MNEQITHILDHLAMISGGIIGVCFIIAIGILVRLAWVSRKMQIARIDRLEDEWRKMYGSIHVLQTKVKWNDAFANKERGDK